MSEKLPCGCVVEDESHIWPCEDHIDREAQMPANPIRWLRRRFGPRWAMHTIWNVGVTFLLLVFCESAGWRWLALAMASLFGATLLNAALVCQLRRDAAKYGIPLEGPDAD